MTNQEKYEKFAYEFFWESKENGDGTITINKKVAAKILMKLANMEKIFTTEDGVDIYPGEKYFSVKVKEFPQHPLHQNKKLIPLWTITGPYINPKAHEPTGNIKYFSTRESAEKFVEENNI